MILLKKHKGSKWIFLKLKDHIEPKKKIHDQINHLVLKKRLSTDSIKKNYIIIFLSQTIMYNKFINFYNGHFKSHINDDLRLNNNVKLFDIVNV